MSTGAHTPGPWSLHQEHDKDYGDWIDAGGWRVDAEGVCQLAFVWNVNRRVPADGGPQANGDEFGAKEAEANARLISAAPQLVAPFGAADNGDWRALDVLLGHSAHGQFWRAVFTDFRAALEKAEGRS